MVPRQWWHRTDLTEKLLIWKLIHLKKINRKTVHQMLLFVVQEVIGRVIKWTIIV